MVTALRSAYDAAFARAREAARHPEDTAELAAARKQVTEAELALRQELAATPPETGAHR